MIDPFGRRTGFDPVTSADVEEIPNSAYFRDSLSDPDTGEFTTPTLHSIIMSQPIAGVYKLIVTGQSSGVSEVSISSLAPDGSGQPNVSILPVTQVGSTSTYELNIAAGSTNTLQLALDQSGPALDQIAAIDAALFVRDPFSVVSASNLLNPASDRNTRIMVFALNLQLSQGETSSAVVMSLLDGNNQIYNIPAEDVRSVPSSELTQVIFRLPTGLAAGTCTIKTKAHNQTSNSGTIRIRN